MFGSIMRVFRFLRSYSYYTNLTSGPVIPIKTNLGVNSVTLYANGVIEGDYVGCEHWLKSVEVRTGPEDRIIFWLLIQYWRQQEEMKTYYQSIADHPAPQNWANNLFDPAPAPVLLLEHAPTINEDGKMIYRDQPILEQIPTIESIEPKKSAMEFEHI